jgi:hypothetical protein
MKVFIWTVIIIWSLEITGKAIALLKRDFERKPWAMVADIPLGVALIIWAAWLLGNGA